MLKIRWLVVLQSRLIGPLDRVVQELPRRCPGVVPNAKAAEQPILAILLPIAEVVERLSRSSPRAVHGVSWLLLFQSCPVVVQELSRSVENQLAGRAAIQFDWSASTELSRSCPGGVQEFSRTPKRRSNPSLQSRSPSQKLPRSCPGVVQELSRTNASAMLRLELVVKRGGWRDGLIATRVPSIYNASNPGSRIGKAQGSGGLACGGVATVMAQAPLASAVRQAYTGSVHIMWVDDRWAWTDVASLLGLLRSERLSERAGWRQKWSL